MASLSGACANGLVGLARCNRTPGHAQVGVPMVTSSPVSSAASAAKPAFPEKLLVGNDVISWKNEHCGCMIAGNDPTRAERNRGGGVAFGRFRDDVLFRKTTKQFAHCAFLFGVGQDQSAVRRDKAFKAPQGFFEAESCLKRGAAIVWGRHACSMAKNVLRCLRRDESAYIGLGMLLKSGRIFRVRKLPFLFPKRDVYGRRCLSRYPFQKLPSSFRLTRCSSSHGLPLALAWGY